MAGNKKRYITFALILCGSALMLWGFARGEVDVILAKSINICLECVGIG